MNYLSGEFISDTAFLALAELNAPGDNGERTRQVLPRVPRVEGRHLCLNCDYETMLAHYLLRREQERECVEKAK